MNQLMEADRMEENALEIVKRPVYVPELLRSCAEEISATTFARNIVFSSSHAPEVDIVAADEGLLRRALMNLQHNAVKNTKPGGQVEVHVETSDGFLVISVYDTGVGIASENIKELYHRFSRLSTTREGWGLGLYFCKLVAEAHGGKIEVKSQPGLGTSVRLAIPLETTAAARR